MPAPLPRRCLHRRRRRHRATALTLCLLAAAAAASAALAACSSSPAALPACHNPEPAMLPHTAGSLTQADTGSYCLGVGQTLDVFLTAPAPAGHTRWGEIAIGDDAVLGYGNNSVMTPPVDVTPGVVVGLARGATTLSSTLPNGTKWSATVVVS